MDELNDPKYRYVSPNANEFNEQQSLAFEHEKRQKSSNSLLSKRRDIDSASSEFRLHNVEAINNFDDASLSKRERNLFSGASNAKSTRYEAVSRADVDMGIGTTGRKTTGRLSKNERGNSDQKRVHLDAAQIKQMSRNEEDDEARQLAEEAAYQRRLKRRITRHAIQEKQFQLPNLDEVMSDSDDDKRIGRVLDMALQEHARSRKNSEAKSFALKSRYQSAEETDNNDDGEESNDEENNDITYDQLHRPYITSNSGKLRTDQRAGSRNLSAQPPTTRPNVVHQPSAGESRRLPAHQQPQQLQQQQQIPLQPPQQQQAPLQQAPLQPQQQVPLQQHPQQQIPSQQPQQQFASQQPQQQFSSQQPQQQIPLQPQQPQQYQQQFQQPLDQVNSTMNNAQYALYNGNASGQQQPMMNVPASNWAGPVNTAQQPLQAQLVGSGQPQQLQQQQQPYAYSMMPSQPMAVTSTSNNAALPNAIGVQYNVPPQQLQQNPSLQASQLTTQQPMAPLLQPHQQAGLPYGAYPSAQLLQPAPVQQQLQQQQYPQPQVIMQQQPIQYAQLPQQTAQFQQPQLIYAQHPNLSNVPPSLLPLLQTLAVQQQQQQQQPLQPLSLFSLPKDPNPLQTTLFQFDAKPNPFFPSPAKLSSRAVPLPIAAARTDNAENEDPVGWPQSLNNLNANRTDYVAENISTLGKPTTVKSYAANHTYRKAATNEQQPMSADATAAKGNREGRGDKVATAPPGRGVESTTGGAGVDNEDDGEQSELLWQKRVQTLAQRSKGKTPANKAGAGGKQPPAKQQVQQPKVVEKNNSVPNNANGRQHLAPLRQQQRQQQNVNNPPRAMAEPIKIDAVVDPERIPTDGSLPLRRTVITEDGQKVDIDINLKMLSPHHVLGPVGQGQGQDRARQRSNSHPRAPGEVVEAGLQPIHQHPHHHGQQQQQRDGYTYRQGNNTQDHFQERQAASNQQNVQYYDNWDEVPVGKHAAVKPPNQYAGHQRQHSGGNQYQVLPSISTDESQISEQGGYAREYQRQRAAAGRGGGEAGYKKYTINDYRRIKQDASNKLGGLGANLDEEKREKLEKQKDYARKINEKNMHDLNDRPPPAPKHVERDKKRQNALDYARNVPKPKPGPARNALEKQPSAGSRRGGSSKSRRRSTGDSEVESDDVSERGGYPPAEAPRHQQQQQQQQQYQQQQFPTTLYAPPPPQLQIHPLATAVTRPKPDTRTIDLEREMQELQRLQERHERERQEVATLLQNMQSVLA